MFNFVLVSSNGIDVVVPNLSDSVLRLSDDFCSLVFKSFLSIGLNLFSYLVSLLLDNSNCLINRLLLVIMELPQSNLDSLSSSLSDFLFGVLSDQFCLLLEGCLLLLDDFLDSLQEELLLLLHDSADIFVDVLVDTLTGVDDVVDNR